MAATAYKCGREELPHVRGQGQTPGGPHARGVAAKRNYPIVRGRGSGQECQVATAQKRLGGATPREARGSCQEELPQVQEAVVAWAQEGREELLHIQGQEGWR